MGQLIAGKWMTDTELVHRADQAALSEPSGSFRGFVTADGTAGPDGRIFLAAAGRYHLIISPTCPFCERVRLARIACGLEDAVSCDVVESQRSEQGWAFAGQARAATAGATPDSLHESRFVHELYVRAKPDYTGRVSVPVLWDKQADMLVSNESAAILAMFHGPLRPFGRAA